jgi:hypothetical protein
MLDYWQEVGLHPEGLATGHHIHNMTSIRTFTIETVVQSQAKTFSWEDPTSTSSGTSPA